MSRRSPIKLPVNKGTLMPHGLPYQIVAVLKETGSASRRDLRDHFPKVRPLTLRNALDSLRKSNRIFVVGWERGDGVRCLAVYSTVRKVMAEPAPLPPISHAERQVKYLRAKSLRAASVFDWRGQVNMGD